ncbi:MAG: SRPBCC family protein [Acidimicrobiia bacterium]
MSVTTVRIEAPRDLVWGVLLDVPSYPLWVVGTKRIRGVEPTWPAPGSTFHHAVGWGPFEQRDSTSVVELEPPRRLVLEVRVRPVVGVARVEITLAGVGRSTDLTLAEQVTRGPAHRLARPLVDAALLARNRLSLHRLKAWCEQRDRGTPGRGGEDGDATAAATPTTDPAGTT